MSDTVVIWPKGVRTEVPADVCRCPIMHVGDACPVHQQILDVPRDIPVALYLDRHEIVVLLRALARAADGEQPDDLPEDPTELSRIVWESEWSSSTARSLATALAEATYR